MQTYNNEIRVHRNETFTLDIKLKMPDGSPFIVSNGLGNPYLLLTISSSKYEQEGRYLKSFWMDLNSETEYIDEYGQTQTLAVPKFKVTVPVDLRKFNTGRTLVQWSDVVTEFATYDKLEGYYNGALITFDQPDDAVFTFGEDYKYWNGETGEDAGMVDYDGLRVVLTFGRDITSQWFEQNYLYSIRLIGGDSMVDFLQEKCQQYEVPISVDPVEMYETLMLVPDETLHNILVDIDPTAPIASVKAVIPVLNPSKLVVLADQQGGLDDYR